MNTGSEVAYFAVVVVVVVVALHWVFARPLSELRTIELALF